MARTAFLIVGLIVPCFVLCTQLTISPTQITVGGENPTFYLNGSCFPPANVTACYTITIGRENSTGFEKAMVEIAFNVNNDEPMISDEDLRPRLSVSGSITETPNTLQFSLRDPQVADVGYFYCKTQFVPDSAGGKEDAVNVTAKEAKDSSGSSSTISLHGVLSLALLVKCYLLTQE